METTEIAVFSRVGVTLGTLTIMSAAMVVFVGYSVIEVARGMRRRTNGHCVECGYDLTGLPSPRCPECGHRF